jgi:uncharacterized membrane protein HdeD (DUF308 family)
MLLSLSRFWWMLVIRGLLAIAFGILVFTRPALSLVSLTLMFGIFALADGIAAVVAAIRGRDETDDWWVALLAGLAGVGVGVITFLAPGITALMLLFYIALWATVIGLLEIVTAIRLRKEIRGEFWLILHGLVAVAFGVFLITRPGLGALSVLALIGGYAIASGILMIALAFRIRGFARRVHAAVGATA